MKRSRDTYEETENGASARGGQSTGNQQRVVHKGDVEDVASHYNAISQLRKSHREESEILGLRNFNNWVKRVLISRYAVRDGGVLDVCCGNGGDMAKFSDAKIGYWCAVDCALEAVKEALRRYMNRPSARFGAAFACADLFATDILPFLRGLPGSPQFDMVSCQFALHYCFFSEERFLMLMRNISSALNDSGAYFVGTIPDMRELLRRWSLCPKGTCKFGNRYYSVEFENADLQPKGTSEADVRAVYETLIKPNPFHHKYMFWLSGAVEHLAEYIVSVEVLAEYAKQFGWELLETMNFGEFWRYYRRDPVGNFAAEQRLYETFPDGARQAFESAKPPMSSEEWEAATVYRTFIFYRGPKGGVNPLVHPVRKDLPIRRPMDESEIVELK